MKTKNDTQSDHLMQASFQKEQFQDFPCEAAGDYAFQVNL